MIGGLLLDQPDVGVGQLVLDGVEQRHRADRDLVPRRQRLAREQPALDHHGAGGRRRRGLPRRDRAAGHQHAVAAVEAQHGDHHVARGARDPATRDDELRGGVVRAGRRHRPRRRPGLDQAPGLEHPLDRDGRALERVGGGDLLADVRPRPLPHAHRGERGDRDQRHGRQRQPAGGAQRLLHSGDHGRRAVGPTRHQRLRTSSAQPCRPSTEMRSPESSATQPLQCPNAWWVSLPMITRSMRSART